MKNILQKNMTHLMIILSLCCGLNTTGWAAGQAQEFQTLELVRTYQTEEEFRTAHPELFPEQNMIVDGEESIKFVNRKTGKLLKQIPKARKIAFTAEELRKLNTPNNTEPVIRDGVTYSVSNNQKFLHQIEYTVTLFNLKDESGTSIEYKRRILYNAQGEKITTLPPEVWAIVESPNQQYFVGYSTGAVDDAESTNFQLLCFYKSDGTLLKQHNVNGEYDKLAYSKNGEFVILFHSFRRSIGIFTKTGDRIFQGDYTELIHDNSRDLYGVFVSEIGDRILLDTREKIYLCKITGELVWQKNVGKERVSVIADCYFVSQKNIIIAKMYDKDFSLDLIDKYTLHILSLSTGAVLTEIKGISAVNVMNESVIISKEGKYYEYKIQ